MRFHIKHVAIAVLFLLVLLWVKFISDGDELETPQLHGRDGDAGKYYISSAPQNDGVSIFDLNARTRDDDLDVLSVPRVHQYCNPPDDKSYNGDEGEVPTEFKLEMVHVIIRHGDRTPLHSIKNQPAIKINCKLDKLNQRNVILQKFQSDMQQKFKNIDQDFQNWPPYPNENICARSQLTWTGVHQHILNGKHLSFKYLQNLTLLDSNLTSSTSVLVKSTDYSRTFQSAVAFLYGFLQDLDFTKISFRKSSNLAFCDKSLGLSCFCTQAHLAKQNADTLYGNFTRRSTIHKKLVRRLAAIYSLSPSKLPWLSAIMDILMAQSCHRIKLPCNFDGQCVDKNLIQAIWNVLDKESMYSRSNNYEYTKFSHLYMHPLLVEISQRMKSIASHSKDVPKFILYSGHDLTLTPLLTALGISNGLWPSYASRLVIEFYSKVVTVTIKHYFIRVLYNGVDLTEQLSFCKLTAEGFCKLKHFLFFIDNHLKRYHVKHYNHYCFSQP